MKRLVVLLTTCAGLGSSAKVYAQAATACVCSNGSTSGVACGANRYDAALTMLGRWKPADNINYHLATSDADMALTGPSGTTLDASAVRNSIQQSANTWNNAPCCCSAWTDTGCVSNPGSRIYPTVKLSWDEKVTQVSVPANGTEPSDNYVGGGSPVKTNTDVINRIWVAKQNDNKGSVLDFESVPGTLAITVPLTDDKTKQILRSRMAINGFQVRWFTGAAVPSECNATTRCYSLQKTVTHEFGHFIGFQHSNCALSVMIPSAKHNDASRLSLHETDVKSVCASGSGLTAGNGYGHTAQCPSDPPATAFGRLTSCTTDAQCTAPLKCANNQYCDIPCRVSSDCPHGEVCPASTPKFCHIGKNTGAPTTPNTDQPSVDFCAPCSTHADCGNGVCVALKPGQNICSAYCTSNKDCGAGSTCTSTSEGMEGVCVPNDPSCMQSAASRRGQLNEACGTDTPCGPNLLCTQLARAQVCLEYCDTDTNNPDARKCTTDGYSCLTLDKDLKYGVCFKATAREGESCLLPDTSQCGFDKKFVCAGTPEKSYQDAACYRLCGDSYGNTCAAEQSCTNNTCRPLPTKLCPLAQFGQKCAKNDECASGFCAIKGGEQACARTCSVSLKSGCPQGLSCQNAGAGDKGFCWPSDGVVVAAPDCSSAKSGCACGSTEGGREGILLAMLVLIMLWRRRHAGVCR